MHRHTWREKCSAVTRSAVGLQPQTFIKLCKVISCSTVNGAAAFMQSGQTGKNRIMFLVYKMLGTIQACTGSVDCVF